MTSYPIPSDDASIEHPSFTMAEAEFGRLRGELAGPQHMEADHASVEQLIRVRGTEVLRLLFEGWCNARADREAGRNVVGSDEIERTHHREARREVESLFGTAAVSRDRVGARGVEALVPGDAALNLPEDRFTFGVRQRVAEEAVRGSFEAASQAVGSSTGAGVAKRQAEELVLRASGDFDRFYQETACRTGPPEAGLLVLTVDGKGVVMRPEGLREATRAAAAKTVPRLKKRLSKGEKTNRKRMATVAAVYFLEAAPRTAGEILGELDGEPAGRRPKPKGKRVFASLKRSARQVIGDVFAEASRRDPRHNLRWVALVDGNKPQIAEIRAAAAAENVPVTLVLDIIHVTEYLWAAAWELHTEGDPAAEKWVTKYLAQLLAGKASTVAAAIGRSASVRKLEKRTSIDKAAHYFLANKDLMRYDACLRDGLPIATGVIEGACRHLVKDRMDITGARWGLDGAEAVLRLRSLHVSGDLDRYWRFHRACEFERNHRTRYAAQEDDWLVRAAA